MQCVSDLAKLRDAVIARARCLHQIVNSVSRPLGSIDKQTLAFATIELDNLVVIGLRQYTKSCLLRSRTAAGQRITVSVAVESVEEAAAHVFRSLNPTLYAKRKSPSLVAEKDEIVFRDPKKTEKVLTDYAASNLANFNLALSLNAQVFSEAKLCRHFFAHRARNTFEVVRQLAADNGVFNLDAVEHLLVMGRPGTGVKFLDGWISDVENFFDLAA
jgi:hypothetical protein